MVQMADSLIIEGRSISKDGKPAEHWTLDCTVLVEGRANGKIGRPFKGRKELGLDLIAGLRRILSTSRLQRHSASILLRDVSTLLVGLDEMESASTAFLFRGGVEALPGSAWFLFTRFLDASPRGDACRRYGSSRRVVIAAAREKFGELPGNFLIPGNPFRKVVAGNWNRSDDLNDEALRSIAALLRERVSETTSRLEYGRKLLPTALIAPRPDDERSPGRTKPNAPAGQTRLADGETKALAGAVWASLTNEPGKLPATALIGPGGLAFSDKVPNQVALYAAFDLVDQNLGITASRFLPQDRTIASFIRLLKGAIAGNLGRDLAELERSRANGYQHLTALEHCRWLVDHGALVKAQREDLATSFIATSCAPEILSKLLGVQAARAAKRLSTKAIYEVLVRSVPTYEDLYYTLALLLMRTGFNMSTALSILPHDWHTPHVTAGDLIEVIYARKARSNGKLQETQSNKFKELHAYDLIIRVLRWTEPLRCLVRSQIEAIDKRIADKSLPAEQRQNLWITRRRLWRLTYETWLYLSRDGEVRKLADIHWRDLQADILKAGIVEANGAVPTFNQRLTRRAWAGFVYDKSGSNLIVTKMLLGHSDLGSLLTYISRQAELNRNRREWVVLQNSILRLIRTGKLTAEAVRELVRRGELSAAEAETIATGATLTRSGLVCSDPRGPDPHVDPQHKPGDLCRTQDCLKGCGRAFVTFETAKYLARTIVGLESQQEQMPFQAWIASDYPHELSFARDLFSQYAPAVQKTAIDNARLTKRRPIFGMPASSAMRAVSNSASGDAG